MSRSFAFLRPFQLSCPLLWGVCAPFFRVPYLCLRLFFFFAFSSYGLLTRWVCKAHAFLQLLPLTQPPLRCVLILRLAF